MNRIVLDTSAYSLANQAHREANNAIKFADEILMPIIAIGELQYGFSRGTRIARNRQVLERFLASPRVVVVGLTEDSAERYGTIAAYLRKIGISVPTNDIWIAAIAMIHGATVVTADKHFQHMPQVVTELLE